MKKQSKKREPIYAIVDLETTGTSVKHGDRIIQIGCVLVQAGQIINQFETKINPRTKIPHSIEQLTGITNSDVHDAPWFDDVADTLESLLSDTIFVAHNVNFDFPFLNAELERAGHQSLAIPAIDTVTLAQILLPTAKSFRLRDLSSYLAIEHDQPHSAASDAEATAVLLIDLLKKVHQLPTLTLASLVKMKLQLPKQTADVFSQELEKRRHHPQNLSVDLYVSNGLVLHKSRPLATPMAHDKNAYPATKKAKEKLFGDQLEFRATQSKMMNSIYNHYAHDAEKPMIIEAGTGVGKTLGYLLPMVYQAYPDRQIVVSTATNLQLQQIEQKTMPQLNAMLPFEVASVVVKGNDHYLDLAKFAHSLSIVEDSKLVQLLKARILVWLLQTTSGDMDELNLNAQQSPYFTEIRHHGLRTLSRDNPFIKDDFLMRRNRQLQHATVVITNHAYLAAHAAEFSHDALRPYLVVDEAQHLSDSILKKARQTVDFQRLTTAAHVLEGLVKEGSERNLIDVFAHLPLGIYNVELLQGDLQQLDQAFLDFQGALYRSFMLNAAGEDDQIIEQVVDNDRLYALLDASGPVMMNLEQSLASVQLHFSALDHLFASRSDSWLTSDRYLMSQFATQLAALNGADEVLHEFVSALDQHDEAAVFWLTVQQSHERSTMKLSGGLLNASHYLSEQVYPFFQPALFVGATLFTSKRSNYLYQQLDLNRDNVKVKHFKSPFNYQQNSRLLIAKDAPMPADADNGDYIRYLSQTIYRLANETQCQTMVLFNSLVTVEQVYSQLRSTDLFNQRDILAQGITGNREKLLKQFATGENSVLLGAASFWEGIDLPNSQLQLLIITRLPFDSPQEILNRAQSSLLKSKGINPFYHLELPKATMRMRQGIGRLLRTPDDYGVAVVLDPRLSDRRYGKTILNALPEMMPVVAAATANVIEETKKFLKNHERSTQRQ